MSEDAKKQVDLESNRLSKAEEKLIREVNPDVFDGISKQQKEQIIKSLF